MLNENKAVHKRFEQEKLKNEAMQSQMNEKDLKLNKLHGVLNIANKTLKHKEANIKQLQEKVEEQKALLFEYSGVQIKKPDQGGVPAGHKELLNFKMNGKFSCMKVSEVKDDDASKIDYEDDVLARELADDAEIMEDEVNQEILRANEL